MINKQNRKSQIALEYLLLIGVVFIVIIAFLYYAISETNETARMNKASDVVTTLAKTADMVYALGPGSQDYVQIDMPGAVESVSINGKEISMKIKIFGNSSNVFAKTKANVTGALPLTSGIYHISVKTLNNETVQISQE